MATNNDPVTALIQYVLTMKPYHSKIAVAMVEYLHTDFADISFEESLQWTIDQIYETNPLDCDEGFGVLPYGYLIKAGSRRLNPFYNSNSSFYNPLLDSSSPLYDPNWVNLSPVPTNREQVVSLVEYPGDPQSNIYNPFYDNIDPEYDDRLDLSSNNYDQEAFNEQLSEFALAVSLQYAYPSPAVTSSAVDVNNPFYDNSSVYYVDVLDSSSANYDPNADPLDYTSEERSASLNMITVDGLPYNIFYDNSSSEYVPVLDRNTIHYNPSVDHGSYTLIQRAVSLVFLPFTETIESNWDNGFCPDDDEHLFSSAFDETFEEELERIGTFNNDLLLLFDRFSLFDYTNDNKTITTTSVDSKVAIAKGNFTLPNDLNRYYWEWSLTSIVDVVSVGAFEFNPNTNIPFEMGRIDNNQHIGEFLNSIGWFNDGTVIKDGTVIGSIGTYGSTDVVGIGVDLGADMIEFFSNGVSQGTFPLGFNFITGGISSDLNTIGNEIDFISTNSLPGFVNVPLNS